MYGIFNVFGDSTQVMKPPKSGPVASDENHLSKAKNFGAPGATPNKISVSKSKGLSIRSKSDLNIQSLGTQPFILKNHTKQSGKSSSSQWKGNFSKSTSINKKKNSEFKSPNKLKVPAEEIFGELNETNSIRLLSPNAKTQRSSKNEMIFKLPELPRSNKKRNNQYPEPENLAPMGELDIEKYDLGEQNLLKVFNNKHVLVDDDDEGFASDTAPIKIDVKEVNETEDVLGDMEVPLPEITSSSGDSGDEFN